jgi:hypothetical protein
VLFRSVDIVAATPKALSAKVIGEKFSGAMQKADGEKVEDKDLAVVEEGLKTQVIDIITEAVNLHTAEEIKEGLKTISSLNMSYEGIMEGEGGDHHGHTEIPFVSTVSGLMEKIPPFKQLTQLANYLGKKSNEFLTGISTMYKELGVTKEVVKFVVLGALIGIGLETLAKGGVKSALLYFFPVLKTALTVVGTIATGIAIVHVVSNLIDGLKDKAEEVDKAAEASH